MGWAFSSEECFQDLVDLERWHRLQEGFAEVIGAGLSTLDTEGRLLTKPSKTPRFCSEVIAGSPAGIKKCQEFCYIQANEAKVKKPTQGYPCHAGAHNFVVPINVDDRSTIGYFKVGPVLLGKREEAGEYQARAVELGVSLEEFMDALREIRTFSFGGVQAVFSLLQEAGNLIMQLSYDKNELQIHFEELSSRLSVKEGIERERGITDLEMLLQDLLEIILSNVGGNSGSIMVLNKEKGELYIKVSRGIGEEVVNSTRLRIGEGVAGLVARNRQSVIVDDRVEDREIRNRMRRPDIKSALISPVEQDDEIVGVINVNHHGHFYGNEDLNTLQQFTRLAGRAISALSHYTVAENDVFPS